ncbi:MAG: glycosyltransferase family 2 protein [Vicinamibacterales bacterium]
MIDLSIVIVSFNAAADLRRCLESIAAAPPRASHEVVVVDNASIDGSAEMAARLPNVRVLRMPTNAGFAAANNVGIRETSGLHVLLLNSDTIVPAGAIDRLLARIRGDASIGIVGPRLVDAAGRAELSFGSMLTPWTEWQRSRLARALARGDRSAVARVEALTRREQTPDWVTGACLLVRRTDAEAVGLLDERYFMYTEDVDFCAAIRRLGRRVLFVPDVEIVHLRGRSGASAPGATRAAYERSHLAFYEKHHPWLAAALRLFRAWRVRA